ncbi:predicted protein [Uncinocarpus reesii 1704]|uniref:Uncharacterized protein n=1 Tax=Uncinocarpus reesii (strain UAMH 1704) TaxID=336963 RepID=C4JTA6_UNCRE|nr:uncharacterized protein UREG_05695 [Uncinocarpus reesii 1704]EEP80853.1 predicted protein [Uncinocarpus reesii 1704]
MKLSAVTFLSCLALSSAWKLDLYASDKRHVSTHGTRDSGCKNIDFSPALKVNRANFRPATNNWPDPGTFELYVNKNCKKLSYRNDKGNHKMTARTIRSYKVY